MTPLVHNEVDEGFAGLGEIEQFQQPSTFWTNSQLVNGVVCTVIGALFIFWGVVVELDVFAALGGIWGNRWLCLLFLKVLPFSVGVAFLGLGLRDLVGVWRTWRQIAVVGELGVARVIGGSICSVRWRELEAVTVLPRSFWSYFHRTESANRFRLDDSSGCSLTFDSSLTFMRGVVGGILVRACDQIAARVRTAINAGKEVPLAGLAVRRDGLRSGDGFLPWSDLEFTKCSTRTFSLFRRGEDRPWLQLKVVNHANVLALRSLCMAHAPAR